MCKHMRNFAKRKILWAKWEVIMVVDQIDVPGMGRSVSLQWVLPEVWHCWWDRIDVPGLGKA